LSRDAGYGYPPEGAPPGIVFVDLDGTLLSASSEKLFLAWLVRTGTVRPAALARFLAGYALHPLRTLREGKGWNRSYLRGLEAARILDLARRFGGEELPGLVRPWTADAVAGLVSRGWRAVLLSASLEPLASAAVGGIPFDDIVASRPAVSSGALTGLLEGPRPWGVSKARLAAGICASHGTDPLSCLAIGDSLSDRHLMLLCGRAVAVCPDAGLRRLAEERGWDVVDGRHARWA